MPGLFLCPTFALSIVTQNPSEVSDGSLMSEKVPISALLPHKTRKNVLFTVQFDAPDTAMYEGGLLQSGQALTV